MNILKGLLIIFSVGLVVQAAPALAANAISNSSNWAGYAAAGGKFTSVAGTWIVPAISNAARGSADTIWVGIGGVKADDLIQAGTPATTDSTGKTAYSVWYELLPQTVRTLPAMVNAGDSVTVSITQQSSGKWLISFKNNTAGTSYQNTFNYDSSLGSAEWVVEAPSTGRGVVSLDNFGTAFFTNCSAVKDGNTVTIAQSGASAITMINGNRMALAVPSALANNTGFSVSRTSAVPTPGIRLSGRFYARGRGYSAHRSLGGFYWFMR